MEESELLEHHLSLWEGLKATLPNDLPPPFLAVASHRSAYSDLEHSLDEPIGEVEDFVQEVDVPEAMLATYDPESASQLAFAYGGVLIPPACLSDPDKQTIGALLHEQVHDVLRSQALIYGLTYVFAENSTVQSLIPGFIELVAHTQTAIALERRGVTLEEYYRIPATYDLRAGGESDEAEAYIEQTMQLQIETHKWFIESTAGKSPINDYHHLFGVCLQEYANDERSAQECKAAYAHVASMDLLFKRRELDGLWKVVEPLK